MKDIEDALEVLEKHIIEIGTVAEWAEKMEYASKDYFALNIRKTYHKTVFKLIIQERLESIKKEFLERPDAKLFSIALDLGFPDNTALYKFIKCHSGLTPTKFREQVRNGSQKKL